MDVYFTTLGNQLQRWQGTLRKIEPTPTVQNNVVLYNALFDVPNPDGALMTQMTAQVFFVVAEAKDAVLVPLSALDRNTVRVIHEDGSAEQREVKLGARNRVMAQVVSGLAPGERVATSERAPQGARAASAAPAGRPAPVGPKTWLSERSSGATSGLATE
jgi:macrolide-specific efflux system membrane fusion protein